MSNIRRCDKPMVLRVADPTGEDRSNSNEAPDEMRSEAATIAHVTQSGENLEGHASSLITPEAMDSIKRLSREFGFEEATILRTTEIVTAQWVGLKCRYGCANYNKSWCCPPAAPSLERFRELLSEYEAGLFVRGESQNKQFYRNNNEKRRWQIKHWKATVALERRLFLMGYYKAFGLPMEACALCKECAYPDQCRFPNEKRPSLEACSIDVFGTLRKLGKPVELAEDVSESYNSYSLILLF